MIDISIVVPAYNEEGYLGACLDAIARERARARCTSEVIVVDNASTDRTGRVAAARRDVRVLREPAKGLTRARQKGLEAARGGIVACVDADTRMPEGWLDSVMDALRSGGPAVCISGPYRYYDAGPLTAVLVRLYWRLLAMPSYLLFGHMVVGGNFAARKAALEAIGGFDTTIAFYGEDTNIARRLASVGKVRFTPSLPMPTSARRLRALGLVRTAAIYALNYLSESLLHRPLTAKYEDVR